MTRFTHTLLGLTLLIGAMLTPNFALAQDADAPSETTAPEAESPAKDTTQTVDDVVDHTSQKIKDLSRDLNESEEAQQVSAGILEPIYQVAETLSFPAFHWVAFALMATGVVSYALQLVLGKLVVLARMSLSLSEILSDALGLAISVIGLVLTTQAAAENSTFTSSPAAVLTASGAGIVLGFVFYVWGQAQEVAAAKGRKEAKDS